MRYMGSGIIALESGIRAPGSGITASRSRTTASRSGITALGSGVRISKFQRDQGSDFAPFFFRSGIRIWSPKNGITDDKIYLVMTLLLGNKTILFTLLLFSLQNPFQSLQLKLMQTKQQVVFMSQHYIRYDKGCIFQSVVANQSCITCSNVCPVDTCRYLQ